MKGSRAASRALATNAVVAFDSRATSEKHGVGHYTRCLLAALSETAPEGAQLVESRRPHLARMRRFDLFHAPWMEGAVLRCQCPMVVTLHDLDALTRRSERLRRGGMHMRLRHLALQRATRVIVHSEELAHEAHAKLGLERERVVVIPQAPAPRAHEAGEQAPASPGWGWEEMARATWEVYERALSEPARPFVSRPRAASPRPGSS